MFDFANSLNQRRRPTRRNFTSWVASFLVHAFLLLMLVQYPELLRGGMYHRFHPLSMIAAILSPQSPADKEDNWRTVAVLRGPMMMPNAATLKKYIYDWNKKGSGPPPVTIRLGEKEKAALENAPPIPRVKQDRKPSVVLPPPSDLVSGSASTGSPNPGSADGASASSPILRPDTGADSKKPADLPPPAPAPVSKPDVAANTAPTAIPNGIKPPSSTPKDNVKIFENEQKAIQTPGSGFFDSKGFPLDEYAKAIKERIKGNWYIPSTLKNSAGHTTIVFFIGKDGRYANARIEPSLSSGNTSLDLAALKAIIDSNPFPPLPKGFPGDHLGAKFVLSYNEQ